MAYPSAPRLLAHQVSYETKMFTRNSIAAFFTLVFPLLLLVLFSALFGNEEIPEMGVTYSQFFAPSLAVFAGAFGTYSNIGIFTAYQRDEGILKRVRGTPLPTWLFFGGKVAGGTLVATVAALIMMGVGVVAYGVTLYPRTVPAAIVTFFVGAGCFAALGLLVAAVSPTGNASTAIVNATLLPIAFISGLWFPTTSDTPDWLVTVGDIFPLKHFNDAFQATFTPGSTGAQFDWSALGYMAIWGVVSLALALRLFKWESRSAGETRRKKRKNDRAG